MASRLLSLKGQSNNIESIAKNSSSDIVEEHVYRVDKNITKQKVPVSNVLGEQIGGDQKQITERK